jgi:long-chain acyl-CoA synthetase
VSRFAHFLQQLQSYAALPCIEGDDRSCTYVELLEEIESWQSRFDELNVAQGSVVGLRAEYSLSAVAALLALIARRVIVAMIPRDRDAVHYLVDARAGALLELTADGSYHWWQRVPHPARHPLIDQLRTAGEAGLVIFTSGSTGRPKAALQSLERFLYKFCRPGRQLRTLAFLLFDHVAGLDTLFYTLVSGGTLILTRRRDPGSILQLIESHRVEVLPTSPSFLRLLCAAGDHREYDLSSLKIITYGSEPMDPCTLARLNARFPDTQMSQKYGTTETGSPRSVSRGNDSLWIKIKSDGVETKVVDGVLWIRSEGTVLGYLNEPSPVDEQGWYCTGDLVDVDGEWIKFRGRVADTINVGGEKVAPTEVEQSILELNFVRDVVVSGEPHALMGQIVAARVALATDSVDPKKAAERIRLHCRERLASYKIPVRVDISAEGFANDRQKVQRK